MNAGRGVSSGVGLELPSIFTLSKCVVVAVVVAARFNDSVRKSVADAFVSLINVC
jgi:hypothetical protein